jgi:hypothetical protein
MAITLTQLQKYLEKNKGQKIPGEHFTFELHTPKKDMDIFPYTIRFRSPNWSKNTVRYIGPKNIKRYSRIFNEQNDPPASAYKNRDGLGSQAWGAPYLAKLLRLIRKQVK